MEKFTIEEIRNYLKSQDSFGDAHYNLSKENIRKVNTPSIISYLNDGWDCPESPTGKCEYDQDEEYNEDSCKHCGEPEERK